MGSDFFVRANPGFLLASGLVVALGAQIFAVKSAVPLAADAHFLTLFEIQLITRNRLLLHYDRKILLRHQNFRSRYFTSSPSGDLRVVRVKSIVLVLVDA